MTLDVKSSDTQMSENSVGEVIKVVDEKKTEGEGVGVGVGVGPGAGEERKSEYVEKIERGIVETMGVDDPVVAEREVVLEDSVDEEKITEDVEKHQGDAPVVVDREVDVEKTIGAVDEIRSENAEKNEGGAGKAVEEKEVDVEDKIELEVTKAVAEREVDVEERREVEVAMVMAVAEREVNVEQRLVMPVAEREVEKKIEGEVVGAGDDKSNVNVEGIEGETAESSTEESSISSDMKDFEKKAMSELRMKVEEAILQNTIFKKKTPTQEGDEDNEKSVRKGKRTKELDDELKDLTEGTEEKSVEDVKNPIGDTEETSNDGVDKDISLWGVPLLPSKGVEGTDVILLKFLRARDFKANEAFDMLTNTLQWRKDYKCDSLLDEEFSDDLKSVAYMDGFDGEGHPICFNVYAPFQDNELYQKSFADEEQRQQLLRWRIQLMEKSIQKLDFSPGGVSSLLQINDLNNAPGLSKKELRLATKQAVALLQDNYPEFVATNIFINVPFWFYAFYALLSPFLAQRTKSKIVFARPSSVTETLLKYIPANEIPTKYGGLKRDNETEFSSEKVLEITVKAVSTESIEIPAPKVGTTLLWDLTVLGWDVTYKEEFAPSDEKSYTLIVRKSKKVGFSDEPTRNSFRNKEPGKVVITIENGTFKKKRVLYRYKVMESSS